MRFNPGRVCQPLRPCVRPGVPVSTHAPLPPRIPTDVNTTATLRYTVAVISHRPNCMGRYRPPAPGHSPYITPEGYVALQNETKTLWSRRALVTQAVAAAAAEGDRSENAEYIYRKKELREIDRRIRYLERRLPHLKVVSSPPGDPSRVFFGAWVTLETEDGRQVVYRIVGSDEADPAKGHISLDSPVARALLKKEVDDAIRVATPTGAVRFYLLDIRYTADVNP
jgi:transcription elongation factor GreB